MEELQRDLINKKINQNRSNLIELFREYQSIDNFKNLWNRIKKNSHKKSMIYVLGIMVFVIIVYLIGLIFFNKHTIAVIVAWTITLIIAVFIIKKEWSNLEDYRNEMISSRDEHICKLLSEKGINSTNIKETIDYFILELEPVNTVYKESPILNSVSKFGSNLFFLLIGIVIPIIIKEKVNQNGVQTYAIIIVVLIIIALVIFMIKIYTYLTRRDIYLDKIRKLVIELKQIDLLNRLD